MMILIGLDFLFKMEAIKLKLVSDIESKHSF